MTRVRLKKSVHLEDLGLPPPTFTRDGQNRITRMVFDYLSVRVTVDVTWAVSSPTVTAFTRTLQDI